MDIRARLKHAEGIDRMGESVPKAFDPDRWNDIPEHHRAEAKARAGFLVMQGKHPNEALEQAFVSMATEEIELRKRIADRGERIDFSWGLLHEIRGLFPLPWRHLSGSYSQRILEIACKIESAARHAAGYDGYFDARFEPDEVEGDENLLVVDKLIETRRLELIEERSYLQRIEEEEAMRIGLSLGVDDDEADESSSGNDA